MEAGNNLIELKSLNCTSPLNTTMEIIWILYARDKTLKTTLIHKITATKTGLKL